MAGCPSTLKNKEGKTPRLLAKDNDHKEALKECRKAEKQSAKLAKGGSRTGEPFAIRVSPADNYLLLHVLLWQKKAVLSIIIAMR